MVNVLADEVDDRLHRVVVGLEVEVEGPAYEVRRAVSKIKLHRGGHAFAVHLDEEAINVVFFVANQAVAHAIGLLEVLGHHGVDVFQIFAEVAVDGLVGQVDGAFEDGHLDIDPVFLVGRVGVGGDGGIVGALETVALDGVDGDIAFLRQVDAEVAARLGQVARLAVSREGDTS